MSHAGSAVVREVRISARPQTIFAFFTDPAQYVRWMGALATLDPRPGGTYRVTLNERDIVRGEYVEVVPYTRVVFTWGWEAPTNPVRPGSSTVQVDLIPDGDATIVRLTHRDLPEAARPAHGAGWDLYLGRLAVVATGGEPGLDPNASAEAAP